MFQPLDPLLHSELRLAVMSLLISADEAEFPYIKEQTGATAGNLSVQVDKLSTACRWTNSQQRVTLKWKRPSRANVLVRYVVLPTEEGWLLRHMLKR